MKRLTLFTTLLAATILSLGTLSAKGLLEVKPECTNKWIYNEEVLFNITLTAGEDGATGMLELKVTTDKGVELMAMSQSYGIRAGEPCQMQFRIASLEAGFYRAYIYDDGVEATAFNFGVRPDEVISPRDANDDFWPFWEQSLKELGEVDPEYKLKRDKSLSGKLREVYTVEMKSWGGETIRGYWVVPKAKGKYPVIVTYMGYSSKPWCPDADSRSDIAEFVLSHRGQGLNEFENKYGDWIRYKLDDRYNYYYRGAFLDAVRAIDFVWSREKCDRELIFVDGGSQGGALTLAAASLDGRIAGAAPFVPFLSDYPDYFAIVDWPKWPVVEEANRLGLEPEQMYDTLSYFDIKNLVEHIKCPVLMGFGLQDFVCPPHTNFAGFNNIPTQKHWIVFPHAGHQVELESEWWQAREEFYRGIIQSKR